MYVTACNRKPQVSMFAHSLKEEKENSAHKQPTQSHIACQTFNINTEKSLELQPQAAV